MTVDALRYAFAGICTGIVLNQIAPTLALIAAAIVGLLWIVNDQIARWEDAELELVDILSEQHQRGDR